MNLRHFRTDHRRVQSDVREVLQLLKCCELTTTTSLLFDVRLDVITDNLLEVCVHRKSERFSLGRRHVWAHVDLSHGRRTLVCRDLLDVAQFDTFLLGDFLACFPNHLESKTCAWHLNDTVVANLGSINLSTTGVM